MSSSDALDDIWYVYQTTLDCLKVASRSVDQGETSLSLFKNTNFVSFSHEEAHEHIALGRSRVHDHLILSLWTVFERQLYSYLQKEFARLLSNASSDFSRIFQAKVEREIEYWRIEDVFKVFEFLLDKNVLEEAKQIKKYRDWITHRNPKKGNPGTITPRRTYRVLSEILASLEKHPDMSQKGE